MTTTAWLAAHLPQLPLEALAATGPADAVVAGRGNRRWIVAAADHRLIGLELGLAHARHPGLHAVERQPRREQQALETLALAAYGFGDRIAWRVDEPEEEDALPRFTLWLEIGASFKLFGGRAPLAAKLEQEFAALGHAANLGIAPTLEGAAALARAGAPPAGSSEELHEALERLPLSLLALPVAAQRLFADSGLRTAGEVLRLPRDALRKRIGKDALNHLDRLTGATEDPRRWYRPPPRFARRIDFETEIDDSERLAFPLRRLCGELARYLRARATGVQHLRMELAHESARSGERAPSTVEASFSAPTRDEALLLRVLREKLGSAQLPAPARSLGLFAEHFAAPLAGQHDLFDTRLHTDEAATAVADRLAARFGAHALWRPALADDHRPEHAWRAASVAGTAAGLAPASAARPAWLLRTPRRLERPPPIHGARERIEGGWWDEGDLSRDYFVCKFENGTRGWAWENRADGRLYLHGLWG